MTECIVRKNRYINTLGINIDMLLVRSEHVVEHANPVNHCSLKKSLEAVEPPLTLKNFFW